MLLALAPLSGCWILAGTPEFEAATSQGGAGGGDTGGMGGSSVNTGGAGGGGAGEGGAGGMSPGGGPCSSLVDDFGNQAIDMKWNVVLDGGIAEETPAGKLHFAGGPGQGATIETATPISLDQCHVYVEVVPQVHAGSVVLLLTNAANSPRVLVELRGTTLYFGLDNEPPPQVGTYDPTAHRWWLIANEADNFVFYTSPDGEAWTYRSSTQAPGGIDQAALYVQLGVYGASGATDVTYDNLNTKN